MPSPESVLLDAVGPQTGYGMPFGGPYSSVYGFTPGSTTAQNQYWQTLNRGFDNQQSQLQRDAFDRIYSRDARQSFQLGQAVTFDPATGGFRFDVSKVPQEYRDIYGDAGLQAEYERQLGDTNEDRVQARQQLEGLAQKRAAQAARTEQQGAEIAGFQRELARYQSPDLLAQMVNPQMQAASNQAMATANAAGMAGGSMGQAANRRAAMQGMGQAAASAVPQAAVAQAGQNFEWQKAREGMINNYYQMQNQRAQQDTQNAMAQAGFQKAMEEYEHGRSMEALQTAGGFVQNFGAAAGAVAPAFGGKKE